MNKRPFRRPIFVERRLSPSVTYIDWINEPRRLTSVQAEVIGLALCGATGQSKRALESVVRKMRAPRIITDPKAPRDYWMLPVWEHGRLFKAKDPGPRWRSLRSYHCYRNAMRVARKSNGRFAYAEGLCLTPFGFFLHAWNVRGKEAFDFTWPMAHLNQYYGVTFDLPWLEKRGYKEGGVFAGWEPVWDYLNKKRARR